MGVTADEDFIRVAEFCAFGDEPVNFEARYGAEFLIVGFA